MVRDLALVDAAEVGFRPLGDSLSLLRPRRVERCLATGPDALGVAAEGCEVVIELKRQHDSAWLLRRISQVVLAGIAAAAAALSDSEPSALDEQLLALP